MLLLADISSNTTDHDRLINVGNIMKNEHTGRGSGCLSFLAMAFSALCPDAVAAMYLMSNNLDRW